jgi:hypothetical protein
VFRKLLFKDKPLLIFLVLTVLIVGTLVALFVWQASQVTVQWSTESELDIIGFNLYRSDSPDGAFVKINDSLIPPAPDPSIGGEHSYVDRNVTWGVIYYYKLETVDRYGNTRLTEPIEIPAGWP